MNKIIWTCWLQGRTTAPHVVEQCLASWERHNHGWELRCLDASSIERYVPISQHLDLTRQKVTAASLSDILRILLLHEYGGLWVDATVFCNRPLDEWLPDVTTHGFFAFRQTAPERPLSSWFLGSDAGNYLVSAWTRRTLDYWMNRVRSDNYFWFHQLFCEMCESDATAGAAWSQVPRWSADGPHALQAGGRMFRPTSETLNSVDWTTPVFKLTHRLPEGGVKQGSLLEHLLGPAKSRHRGVDDSGHDDLLTPIGPIAPASVLPPP